MPRALKFYIHRMAKMATPDGAGSQPVLPDPRVSPYEFWTSATASTSDGTFF